VTFPRDVDFCCLALQGPRLQVKQEHTVLAGLTVSNTQNEFELEPHWGGKGIKVKWVQIRDASHREMLLSPDYTTIGE